MDKNLENIEKTLDSEIVKSKKKIDLEIKNVINGSESYENIEKREKATRQSIINRFLNSLIKPINDEQQSKNKYRKIVLVAYSFYMLILTILTYVLLFKFLENGYDNNESKVAGFLISGIFSNLIGLALIIFKYLFSEKHSLLKDTVQIITKTIENEKDLR